MNRSTSRDNMSKSIPRNKNTASTTSQSTGRESSKNETITIDLAAFHSTHSPQSPLGMLLAPQKPKSKIEKNEVADIIVVAGWEKLSNGRLGPVQTSGAVRLGDRLVQVNRMNLTTLKFQEVMGMLRSLRENGSLRSLTFSSSKHLQKKGGRRDGVATVGANPRSIGGAGNEERSVISKSQSSLRRKYTFSSYITRFRINPGSKQRTNENQNMSHLPETSSYGSDASNDANGKSANDRGDNNGPFTEYQIECILLTRGYGGEMTESTQSWTLWKRFSQFQELYEKLIHVYGWQLTNVETNSQTPFPSKKPFSTAFLFLNARLRENFSENRRMELDKFWQSMLKIEEITDFAQPHRYSRDLASFLSIEEYLYPPTTNITPAPRNSPYQSNISSPNSMNETNQLQGQDSLLIDDSSSSGEGEGKRRQDGMQPPFYFPSEIRNDNMEKKNFNSGQKNPAYFAATSRRSKKEQYKNRIPAKSSFQRHVPGLVGSSPLVFRNALIA